MKYSILNIKNKIEFFVRNRLSWAPSIPHSHPIPTSDLALHDEISEFLIAIDLISAVNFNTQSPLVADIGARNFGFAPAYENYFNKYNLDPQLFGIEIDAHRRLQNGRTRAAYGKYFAQRVKNGSYHAMDFLNWKQPLHVAFLLHPFVTVEPLLSWGLPIQHLNPYKIFEHAYQLLKSQKGILILSNPSLEEFNISLAYATDIGFTRGNETIWSPGLESVQKKSRYGIILHT
ncbi:MAG: hypothetical protein SGI74_04760 [Oligoflexia bacterium]|nr:hypothetical protein [Oligoflexia bacterium]